jgi:hypothetical protein
MRHALLWSTYLIFAVGAVHAEFAIDDDGAALTVREGNAPVLTYNYGMVEPPERVGEQYRRACYVHPLYGLDGEVLTQDFPIDHRHHRGVFWTWPESTYDGQRMDVWLLDGVRPHTVSVDRNEALDGEAVIAVTNAWRYDDAPEKSIVQEEVIITVHPASEITRAIDFDLTFTNVSDKEVVIRGSKAEDKTEVTKGYGGFCFRPDATRKPMQFTYKGGIQEEDVLSLETPWCDVSFPTERRGDTLSGAAIFQHPGNPGYPHEGWILRNYGFLGASWPHTVAHVMAPGDSFQLRYRLLVHKGDASEAGVAQAFETYVESHR